MKTLMLSLLKDHEYIGLSIAMFDYQRVSLSVHDKLVVTPTIEFPFKYHGT
jgi:hypothetical protein